MTLLFADGFEDGNLAWALTNMVSGTGRFGNGVVGTGPTARADLTVPAVTSLIIGCAVKPVVGAGGSIIATRNTTTIDTHITVDRGSSGELTLYRGITSSNVILATAPIGTVPAGAWSYVELKVVIHDTTGSAVVRVNGVVVMSVSNVDTKSGNATTINQVRLGNEFTPVGTGQAWDDFYLCDFNGTVNNDFLGDLVVEHLRPASDDTVQWMGSDGNTVDNWALVDEAGAFNSADYVGSSTVGQRDLYVPVPSIRPASSPVLAVMPVAVAMKTDAGTRNAKLVIKEGAAGAVRLGPDTGLPTTFGEIYATFERKNDGTPWTINDVNALRFGIEVSA